MRSNRNIFSRREVLRMALGIGGLKTIGIAQSQTIFTPPLILGPFYPQVKPRDSDVDLTIIKGNRARAEGRIIHLKGTLRNKDGKPLPNRRIEIWQADTNGRYDHPSDTNKARLDPNFQGYASLRTDRDGNFRIKTVMPGPYPSRRAGMRTPHIHFEVHGETDRLVTQMFFPDVELNKQDEVLHSIRNEAVRNTLIARALPPDPRVGRDELLYGWDCVLYSG